MIAPLTRATAKVSNLISRSVSKRSIAPIRPEQAVGDQVGLLDVRGQARGHAPGDELDQGRVGDDQSLAGLLVALELVATPELAQLDCLDVRFHLGQLFPFSERYSCRAYARG